MSGVSITDVDPGNPAANAANSLNDNITLIASTSLTVNQAVVNDDGCNVVLTASTTDLTIAANVTVTGGNAAVNTDGNITLTATAQDLFVSNGVTVSTDAGGSI